MFKPSLPLRCKRCGRRDNIAFGEVRGGNSELGAGVNVTALPRLLVICNGDVAAPHQHTGDLKSEPIRAFLDGFAGGGRCRRAVRLTAETDYSAMRTRQLRELLRDRGLACPECIEKGDYIAKLRASVAEAS